MAFCKGVARASFEVFFETPGQFRLIESHIEAQFPGGVFGGMRALAGIVLLKAPLQIGRVTAVELLGMRGALKHVSVEHVLFGWPGLPSVARRWSSPPSLKLRRAPSFARQRASGAERRMVEAAGVEPASLAGIPAATTCLVRKDFSAVR